MIGRAAIYEALADADDDKRMSAVYRRLAQVERTHDDYDGYTTSYSRLLSLIARHLGPSLLLPVLAKAGDDDRDVLDAQRAVRGGDAVKMRRHARAVQVAARAVGGLPGRTLAELEGRHHAGGGNALRAAVLGANDGLVSNLSLVMGVAGAAADSRTILMTGLAGLIAGACSMAMGEWLSVNSAREMTQRQIDIEAAELEAVPEMEKEELTLIYQANGLDEESARAVAEKLFAIKGAALDTLSREELGIDPDELGGSAWTAAVSSFGLFAIGAIFPVAPFIYTSGHKALLLSLLFSGVALFLIGAVTSAFTGRSLAFSAARQLVIGFAAATITFGVGRLIGVTIN
jgi:vacuolar iron transporter family protein